MRRLLLGVPLIVGLGVSVTHAETISEGMNSSTYGVFSVGSFGSGSWSGEIQSQGMMMSNGIIYSQGMEIPDFGVAGGSTSGVSSWSYDGSDASGGSAGGGSAGSVIDPSPSIDAFTSTLPSFAGLDAGGSDSGAGPIDAPLSFDSTSQNQSGGLIDEGTTPVPKFLIDFTGPKQDFDGTVEFASVPEPATLSLLGTALLGLGLIRRRRT